MGPLDRAYLNHWTTSASKTIAIWVPDVRMCLRKITDKQALKTVVYKNRCLPSHHLKTEEEPASESRDFLFLYILSRTMDKVQKTIGCQWI
jgi:hypothetical protein